MQIRRWGVLSALFLPACLTTLRAQSGVVYWGREVLPGATVSASQGDRHVTTTTDENGRYRLPTLAKGAWTIEVTMFGFEAARKVVNDPDASARLDFNLELRQSPLAARLNQPAGRPNAAGAELESQIENAGSAGAEPPAAPAATEGSSNETFLVSGTLSQGLAGNTTAASGSFPGPSSGAGGTPSAASDGPAFGGPGNGPRFQGGPGGFGGPPGGRMQRGGPGGPRGGGPWGGRGPMLRTAQAGNWRPPNQIHGMLFGSLDNSALNAKPFSLTGQDIAEPAYAQARLGLVLGGPLAIPKIVSDESTFFFFSYFATRARNPYTAVETVPTALERQGDFSGLGATIYDPLTHQPFPGNVIPSSAIDPIARQLLGYFPLPNQPGTVNNFAFQGSAPQNTNNVGLGVMRNVTRSDRLAFHFNYQGRNGDAAQPFGFMDATSGTGINTSLAWTRNLSPTLINNASVNFNRNENETVPFFANGLDVAAALGIEGTSSNPINYGPPTLNFTNFGALSDGTPVLTRNQSQGVTDNVTLSRGQHTFTFGGGFSRNDLSTATDPNGRGTFNFTGLATSAFGPDGAPLAGTGFDFADFLLGLPQSSSIRYGSSSIYLRQNVLSGYAQDDWKVRPDLTLNLGVRYEFFSPFSEKYGRMANLEIAPGFTGVSVVMPGMPGVPSGLVNPDYNNFAPRLGLAWKIPGIKRSTILRAGYGIYYNGQAYNGFAMKLAQQPPFAVSNNISTSTANVLTLANGFLATAPGEITNTYAVDPYYRTPYAQTWNLTIQHELPSGFFLEVGYIGTKGTGLDVLTLPNQGPGVNLQSRTQLGNAVGFTFDDSVGNSIYNALQTRLQRRFRHGISMSAIYTFSKSIDDSSTFGGAGNTVAQNWLDLAAERGLSSFDRRHVLTTNWVWTSPVGADSTQTHLTPAGRLLANWQISGGLTAETGTPLTARVLGNTAQLAQTGGIGSGRAEATGAPVSSGAGFFNLAAFTIPPPGEFGNAGRNTIPGPGLFSLNLALARSFQLGESSRRRLELRMEANNALNNVNYTNVSTVVNATNYGLPVSAASMRSMTAVLRFRF